MEAKGIVRHAEPYVPTREERIARLITHTQWLIEAEREGTNFRRRLRQRIKIAVWQKAAQKRSASQVG
jgi:hypothetical protein